MIKNNVRGTLGLGRPRREDAVRRRELVLDTAAELFMAQGYEATSMELIARRAGSSKQTLYAWFPAKADLFHAVFKRRADSYFHRFTETLNEQAPLPATLIVFAGQLLDIVVDREATGLRRMVLSEAHRFPELGEVFFNLGPGRCLNLLAAFLQARSELGELTVDNPQVAAEQFASLVLSGMIWLTHLGVRQTLTPEQRVERIERAVQSFLKIFPLKPFS